MSVMEKLDRALMHPITVISAALGILGSVMHVPFLSAVVATVWHQAGTIFAAVSVVATQGWLPAGTGEAAMLVAGALFLGRLGDKVLDALERRLEK